MNKTVFVLQYFIQLDVSICATIIFLIVTELFFIHYSQFVKVIQPQSCFLLNYTYFFSFQDEAIEDVKKKIKFKLKQSPDIDDIELHYHSKFTLREV